MYFGSSFPCSLWQLFKQLQKKNWLDIWMEMMPLRHTVPCTAFTVFLCCLSFFASEGPLESIVSMGSRHPVPQRGMDQSGRYPPLDLIQWIYQMERDRKVRADDITVPARRQVQYCTQSGDTHVSHVTHTLWFTIPINHWRRLISYGFQFPPGHICIDQLQV